MPLMDRIDSYSVYISQNNYLTYDRSIRLKLASGSTAFIGFEKVRRANWLVFANGTTTMYMPIDQFDEVYHLVQTESPVFITAIRLFGLEVGAVHTELDLDFAEPTGEGTTDIQSLEEFILRARSMPEEDRHGPPLRDSSPGD